MEENDLMDFAGIMERYLSCQVLEEKRRESEKFVALLKNKQIVIYGAGAVGVLLVDSLRMHGIEPMFLVDRRWQICKDISNVPVRNPEALIEVNVADTVVIMAINAEVIREFNQEPLENVRRYCPDAILLTTGIHVNSILRYAHCCRKLEAHERFDLVECLNCGAETDLCRIYQEYLYQIVPGRTVMAKRPSQKFDWFGYIMGQCCTLKCKDCCEHVPYFENPVFSKYEDILADCKKIAGSCQFIRYIELIGGEPFLHPQFLQVLEGLLKIENVGYVKIFTNGTIVPKQKVLDLLKNPRIVVNISNYTSQATGKLLENIYQTMKCLEDNEIPYVYSESKEWTDWGGFQDRGRTDEQLTYNASHCFCYNCHRVFRGILYRCPHQYAGIQLGEMEYVAGEYIDLNSCSPDELADQLDAFEALPFTDGCRRCDMPFDCPVIPAGIQLD